MMEHVQVVILGGGPAGYTAALYCARAGFRTVILEKLSAGGQMATTAQIDNYPGFDEGVDGFELGMKMQAQAERFGAETYLEEVLSVDLTAVPKKIVTDSRELTADAVILATGASARKLGVPEEDSLVGRGVAYCATCDGMFYKGKTVAVIGGGNTAAADALFLSRICEKVILIHRRDTLRADRVYLNPLQSCDNLEFIWNSTVDAILHDQKVTGLRLRDKFSGELQELACDGVFVAVGQLPNTALVEGQLKLDHGYIAADETTRTSLPGVFAIGDVRTKALRQVITAASDGAVASHFVEEYLASL